MKKYDISDCWNFYESEECNSYYFTCPDGEIVDLPHDFIIGKPRFKTAPGQNSNGYFGNGQGVYRKTLDIPYEWKDKTVLLEVDGAYMNTEITVNRELMALHPNGYTPFLVDITPALRFDGRKNRLKIITQSRQPSTRWYSGGGLYRSVSLWVGEQVHIKPWDAFVTTTQIAEDYAVICVNAKVCGTGPAKLRAEILDDGRIVANCEKAITAGGTETLTLTVEHPTLWSPETPHLYECRITAANDTVNVPLGIRTVSVSAEKGFLLNGKSLKLKGGCIHHDNGILGARAYPRAEERKIQKMLSLGFNAVRISHNPPSSALLDACDRLGMLVLDEAFDAWRLGKMPMDYHLYFKTHWESDIENMVKRDRNHPSVIMWSIGNEIYESNGTNEGPLYAKRLSSKVRELDATRPVTCALCSLPPAVDDEDTGKTPNVVANSADAGQNWNLKTKEFCEPLDVVGYNYLKELYEESHKLFPERVILGTESFPLEQYDYWKAVEAHPYVIGDFVWAAWDYFGETAVGKTVWSDETFDYFNSFPWRSSWCADFDITGGMRPQGAYRKVMWGDDSDAFLFTCHPSHYGKTPGGLNWRWADVLPSWSFGTEYLGKMVSVEAYGRGNHADFLLNGRKIASAPVEKLIAKADIAYVPGKLEAVFYENGKEISRAELVTAEGTAALRLTPESDTIKADGRDVAYIHVSAVDEHGVINPNDDREISVRVNETGIFLACGSADPMSEERIGEPRCRLFGGAALIAVRSKVKGTVQVQVFAEGCMETGIAIQSK